ncbi:hypothetical protein LEP1GSC016_3656 [Leptospira borgpetersenii serovar Hardjo-bovis str. Sponselee]|uniref:Uncharacterized protein n=1 Tax=Leptospira borgpetersenii serovar Hardjo-bovis str. Sponselee TaxID=1303729 RepID=M6BHS8_LEPBO|nr:hypothetical protein B9T54_17775 [Leptospira borgpetersenii serovar Hardjo-bovis]AYR10221.1 hypothetical protein D1609_17670 [Leptospira borgpetersenii serovar Hardjo-bovis]EMJ78126.1 hypothetical protein LEP1GSC016_3656 [Leptospira borgpetersenii serovar Hardjo-bovis str. Sponselee]TQE52741.1 hypothetical protein FFZ95_09710 [Leptospira borgpetersenii]TQE56622.1 hypothetical protein FFZ96_09280 [Leptospira borgpetersenii]
MSSTVENEKEFSKSKSPLSIQSKNIKTKLSSFSCIDFTWIQKNSTFYTLQKMELTFRSILFFGTQYRRQM